VSWKESACIDRKFSRNLRSMQALAAELPATPADYRCPFVQRNSQTVCIEDSTVKAGSQTEARRLFNADFEVVFANFGICCVKRGRVPTCGETNLFLGRWRGLTPMRCSGRRRSTGFGPKGKFRKSEFGFKNSLACLAHNERVAAACA